MKSFILLTILIIGIIWAQETLYFEDYRLSNKTGEVSETFIRKGRLGKLLRKNGMVEIAPSSHISAIADDCAKNSEMDYGDFQNRFKIRANIYTSAFTKITITVAIGEIGQQTHLQKTFASEIGRPSYDFEFIAPFGKDIYIKYAVLPGTEATLLNANIQPRFTDRALSIISNGAPVNSIFKSVNIRPDFLPLSASGILMQGSTPEVTQHLPGGIPLQYYANNFLGSGSGTCNYIARQFDPSVGGMNRAATPYLLPRVKLSLIESDLYGDKGIIDNKNAQGRLWEKPAMLSVDNQVNIHKQKVGVRFHGGTPGRKRNIESFRVYARKKLGLSTINAEAILGTPSNVNFKTLVFKYTFQVLITHNIDFNPFIHSLALDVAKSIGAIVPRFHLVDLTLNDQEKGLYLAMEHLSDRTLRHWLKSDKFSTYTYKSYNTPEQSLPVFSITNSILSSKGEDTLETLEKHMDLDNVLNSILLTAYIADDDYCQGVEVITENNSTKKLTSINWDLDHAFFSISDDQPYINPQKHAFLPIVPKKKTCVRQWMYGWTYIQSARFRLLLRQRMEELLDTVLSKENAVKMLDYYKKLNQAEFSGKYSAPIAELEDFMVRRPDVLRKLLTEMETRVENITPAQLQSWN